MKNNPHCNFVKPNTKDEIEQLISYEITYCEIDRLVSIRRCGQAIEISDNICDPNSYIWVLIYVEFDKIETASGHIIYDGYKAYTLMTNQLQHELPLSGKNKETLDDIMKHVHEAPAVPFGVYDLYSFMAF